MAITSKALKKQFPYEHGWLHATLQLKPGATMTEAEFKEQWVKDGELGHFSIRGSGTTVKAVYREAKHKGKGDPPPASSH